MPSNRRSPWGLNTGLYDYTRPTMSQYESFFEPIPLEFIQQQFDRRQTQYDTAFGSALQAKDAYSNIDVADTDIDNRNRIVTEFTNNMDQMVKERYGGDWGRAAKDVARNITDVRLNPFWDTSRILKERQKSQAALIKQFGNNALVFQDVMNIGSIDPETGRIRGVDELIYDVRERGDWDGSIDRLLSRIQPNVRQLGLSPTDYGLLQSGRIREITEEGLLKIANDPMVRQAILSENPEMLEAFQRLPQDRRRLFGQDYADNEFDNALTDLIMGRARPMIHRQTDIEHRQNPLAAVGAGDQGGTSPYSAVFVPGPVPTERGSTRVLNFDNHPDVREHQKKVNRGFLEGDKKHNRTREEYFNELKTKHPELANLPEDEAFAIYENYIKQRLSSVPLRSNLKLDNSNTNARIHLMNNIQNIELTIDGKNVNIEDMLDKTGYSNLVEFNDAIKDMGISPLVDFEKGTLVLPVNVGGNVGNNEAHVTEIHYKPDKQTQDILEIAKLITNKFYNSDDFIDNPERKRYPVLDHNGNPTGQSVFVAGTGNIVDGNDKMIFLVDEKTKTFRQISIDEFYTITTQSIDQRFHNMRGLTGNPGIIR